MNYHSEYRQAKKLLDDGSYNLCSMQCGRVVESMLKELLNELLNNFDIYQLQPSIKSLLSNEFANRKRVTLGKLIHLIKRTNAIDRLSEYHGLDKKGLNSVDFDTIVTIRNKAQHEGNDDSGFAATGEAYIIYGYLLKLIGYGETLIVREKKETVSKTSNQGHQIHTTKVVRIQSKIVPKKAKTSPNIKKREKNSKIDDFVNVCRNKSKENYFILLNYEMNNEALFILPDGKVKTLSRELFHEAEEIELLKAKKLITKKQLDKLASINVERKSVNKKRHFFRTESKSERQYIEKYRNMLNNPNTIPSIILNIIRKKDRVLWKDVKRLLIENYGYKESGSFGASLRVLTLDGFIETFGKGDEKMISIKT